MTAAPSLPREQHVIVPIEKVHESPFNRRRTWGNLEELAASFASVGVLEDLLGRPHPKRPGEIELAAGHRRRRAGKLAKLTHLPIKVRELTDDQVLEIQLIENIQREDIHPIEEAETFELQREKAKLSVDELAAKVGKSKAYVYARLKLLPGARAAAAAGREGGRAAVGGGGGSRSGHHRPTWRGMDRRRCSGHPGARHVASAPTRWALMATRMAGRPFALADS